jgi:hypothetical protein
MARLKCLKCKRFQIYFYLLVGITNWYTLPWFHSESFQYPWTQEGRIIKLMDNYGFFL